MAHQRQLIAGTERIYRFLIEPVSTCYPTVLALMLDPAFDDEAFDHAPFLGRILPDVPADRAVTLPHGMELAQCSDEFGQARRVDAIFDLDGNRAAITRRLDATLVAVVARGHAWFGRIARGEASGPGDIAVQNGLARSDVSRALPLAFLAPDIVRAILEGRQPPELTRSSLLRLAPTLPSDWEAQRRVLGFAGKRPDA